MGSKLFLLIVCCWVSVITLAQHGAVKGIDWNDSVSINAFVKKASLCEMIQVAEDSAAVFAGEEWKTSLILLVAIVKKTKTPILIPTNTEYAVWTKEDKICEIKQQLKAIRNRFCPASATTL